MKLIKNRKPMTKRPVKAETDIAPDAADLLFEAEDVAQLVAEITGEDVEVTADENEVTFEVAGEEFTCTAEEDIDEVESSKSIKRSMKRVAASKKPMGRKPMGKTVRKLPKK